MITPVKVKRKIFVEIEVLFEKSEERVADFIQKKQAEGFKLSALGLDARDDKEFIAVKLIKPGGDEVK